jgi:thiol-disulfide isomerase/thioredoxin
MRAARLLVLGLLLLSGCTGPAAGADPSVGQIIPPGQRVEVATPEGQLVDGGELSTARPAGQVLVVNFWASWCAPCVAEADDLEATYQATRDDGVAFVGINTRDERDAARRFMVGRSSYPSLFDPEGRLALGLAVPPTAIPSTVVIDRHGRIALVVPGAVVRSTFEPLVAAIAAEPGPVS